MKSNIKSSESAEKSKAVANNILSRKEKNATKLPIPKIQFKLSVGKPGDKYEQEADRVASQVMRMPETLIQRQPLEEEEEELMMKPAGNEISPLAQRQPLEEEEEMLQPKELSGKIRMQPLEEEEEMLQPKFSNNNLQKQSEAEEEEEEPIQAKEDSGGVHADRSGSMENRVNELNNGGFGLPDSTRGFMEERFGLDFGGVNIHNNTNSHEMARDLNAQAFTIGNNIAFGAGRYNPGSDAGKELLAHELTHVVQQRPDVVPGKSMIERNAGIVNRQKSLKGINGKVGNNIVQRNPIGKFYGEAWEAYVYPSKAKKIVTPPGATDKEKEAIEKKKANRKKYGERVRDFQRFEGRNVKTEDGKKIITIGSSAFDRREKTKSFDTGKPEFTKLGKEEGKPAEWDVTLNKYMLFDPKPSVDDLSQGGIGDCWLLAVLQSVARTAAGKTHLMNMIKPAGNNYSVEFFRLKVSGKQALPDTNSKIRVSVTKKKSNKASGFKTKGYFNLGADELSEIRKSNPEKIKPADKLSGIYYKYITWPWAVEKAFATIAGTYSKLDGGYADFPMMVILGRMPSEFGNFTKKSESDIEELFKQMRWELNHNNHIALSSMSREDMKKHGFSKNIFIKKATSSGVRIYTDLDSSVSGEIKWSLFDDIIKTFKVLDLSRFIQGEEGSSVDRDSMKDERAELTSATSRLWTVIPGELNDGLAYHKGRILVPGHVYSLQFATQKHLNINNPWGKHHLKNLTAKEFKKSFNYLVVGR